MKNNIKKFSDYESSNRNFLKQELEMIEGDDDFEKVCAVAINLKKTLRTERRQHLLELSGLDKLYDDLDKKTIKVNLREKQLRESSFQMRKLLKHCQRYTKALDLIEPGKKHRWKKYLRKVMEQFNKVALFS